MRDAELEGIVVRLDVAPNAESRHVRGAPTEIVMKANIRILSALAALGFLAACSRPDAQVLNDRVTARMTPPLPCNSQATVEYLPNGARIMIPDTALFIIGKTDISECG